MAADPNAPITQLKGVGPSLQQTLAKLGVFRLIDLMLHLPFRYQDRSRVTPLAEVRAGGEYLVQGRVTSSQVLYGKRRSLKVCVEDHSGRVYLRFFHYSRFQQNKLQEQTHIRAFGEFRFFGRELTAAHPEYETFTDTPEPPAATLTPIYPTTQNLGQARMRKLTAQLCGLDWADSSGTPYGTLKFLHQPPAGTGMTEVEEAQQAIALDELTAFYLVMKGRALQRQQDLARALPRSTGQGRALLKHLGFRLTKAQARVVSEVLTDLENPVPMLRLVQGDVGSGKTVIAAFAAIRAAEQGCQTALMAPTELLAEQHFINFSNWLTPLGMRVTLLTGQLPAAEQRQRLAQVLSGEAQVVIGTHALFQEKVSFHQLALSIIDEQHRFGVHQRMALKDKGQHSNGRPLHPHQLVMTATPIPRTLTMALYADMDVSVIDELPKGRQPITTHTLAEEKRPKLVETINKVLRAGHQAYWVCTLIDESDELEATAATTLAGQLTQALPDYRVALLHGRMKSDEKLTIMHQFKNADIDLLVATTVIEVGVDVANATHMVVENSERLGLAQLHQLRGRVGRGAHASHCYLLYSPRVSEAGKTRIEAMRHSQDGFYLAEQDLKLRGPGDILGTRQAGEQSFRIADLGQHAHLMPQVIKRGDSLLQAASGSTDAQTLSNLLHTWAPADSGHLTV